MSLQNSHQAITQAPLPQLERGIAVSPIRDLNAARAYAARPATKPLSQRIIYAAAIVLCVFAIGQCIRATCTHLFKLQTLLQASGAVHTSAVEEYNTNLSLKDPNGAVSVPSWRRNFGPRTFKLGRAKRSPRSKSLHPTVSRLTPFPVLNS